MLPVANLQTLYDSTVEFFALRSPSFSFRGTPTTEDPTSQSDRSRVLTPVPDPVERLTRECVSLRERLNAADRRHSACPTCQPLGSSNTTLTSIPMRREFDVMKNELARSRTEVTKLEERCKLLEKTLKETRDLVRAKEMEIERIRRDDERQRPGASRRGSSASEIQTAEGSRREVTAEESMLQSQRLRPSPSRNGLQKGNCDEVGRTIAAMEESRAQARCLEIFMTRTDSWSGAQILQAVHDLNSEILQFAASATELCTFERTTARSTPSRSGQAMHDTSSRLGAHVTRVLTTRDHAQDPILVQIALQGCISTCIARALSTFCMGFPSKSDVVLAQIYSSMFVNEPQPTSSKWRALTHRHIHELHPTLGDFAINELTETILRWSADILLVTKGCSGLDSAPSRDGLRTHFGDQVRRIASSASKLAHIAREEIMSTNFEVIAVEWGEVFDTKLMSDAFGDYGTSRGSIITTTELGLRCTTRKSSTDAMRPEDEGVMERRILLQPKVVLESVLDVLDPK